MTAVASASRPARVRAVASAMAAMRSSFTNVSFTRGWAGLMRRCGKQGSPSPRASLLHPWAIHLDGATNGLRPTGAMTLLSQPLGRPPSRPTLRRVPAGHCPGIRWHAPGRRPDAAPTAPAPSCRPRPRRTPRAPWPAERAAASWRIQHASPPIPGTVQRSRVDLALRRLADDAAAGLPDPRPATVDAAARSRETDLADVLDRAVATTDLGWSRRPLWWRAVGGLQAVLAAAVLAGALWLAGLYALSVLRMPELPTP